MTRLLIGPLLRYVGTTQATVWVETDESCTVEVRCGPDIHRERTWTVEGHHYALVLVDGLTPGTSTPYEVDLNGEPAWPSPRESRPPSRIRTLDGGNNVTLAFGSCRYGRAATTLTDRHFDADSLAAYARRLAADPGGEWPDAVIMLGDQVYADETSDATRRRIMARRDIDSGAKDQVADFEEYTWLYLESWTDPDVRWLLSTVASSMIFDDHDVRDDWNTSDAWRRDMQATGWWQERIVGGLASYWVYQHLGNLTPDDLAGNELYARIRESGEGTELLRGFAARADAEADGVKGTRWSYRRDFGRTRLLMIDSRCGRILAGGARSMVSHDEFAWITAQTDGDYDHLLIGTSLPWLLARSLHDVEAWDEALASGARGQRIARFGEWLRRAGDLEHWAAFRDSFEELGELIASVGRRPDAPATICVLSGDVHHAYVARARFPQPVSSAVYQLTCSPLNNYVPLLMKLFFRVFWSRAMASVVRTLARTVGRVPRTEIDWDRLSGPFFGNEIAEFVADGRRAETTLRRSASRDPDARLVEVDRQVLAS